MKTAEIRQRFLTFFQQKQHEIVHSSPLVPGNDPTLLFTNAGMVQFKDVFLGTEKRSNNRATTAQKCVRAGGKHNDLENVGYTARHHTFFEMLGNFSFGDYFKEQAISYAWEMLTQVLQLPEEKLWVTVFEEDDEAYGIWADRIGVPKERILRIGAKDNFWQMGDTGPCGPCTEIFYDHGPDVPGGPPGSPDEDGDRYIEIWNLVFMQYDRDADGTLHPLPAPSVDTGMGLERIAAVLQGVHSNYEIDLFVQLIAAAANIVGCQDLNHQSLKVIADHIRSTSFLIADGVTPSNEGRGYVLRRIIRRAVRHGYQLGQKQAFMHLLVPALVEEMGQAYPELALKAETIARVLEQENRKFNDTLEQGLAIFNDALPAVTDNVIAGDVVYKLYDTYGFPVDLTADLAREKGLSLDLDGYDVLMEAQRQRARGASQFDQQTKRVVEGQENTTFVGYDTLIQQTQLLAIQKQDEAVNQISEGDHAILVLSETPFYAESGGQVGDQGEIITETGVFSVTDTQNFAHNVIAHIGTVTQGQLSVGDTVSAQVTEKIRAQTVRHHSATHLLHKALKEVLGSHVQQRGSLVTHQRLRFDFSHFEAMTAEELSRVEHLVNREIRSNHAIAIEVMAIDAAKAAGAEALFGEKYGESVRTIKMGEFSFELCGGTHVERTGDIGFFKLLSEAGVAAGVRRIEAVAGVAAENYVAEQMHHMDAVAALLKTQSTQVADKVSNLLQQTKTAREEIQSLKAQLLTAGSGSSGDQVLKAGAISYIALRQDGVDGKSMRMAVDQWKQKLHSVIVVIAGVDKGKVTVVAGVTDDLSATYPANELLNNLAPIVNGRGGGKAVFAQAGGDDLAAVDSLLEKVGPWIEQKA